jgi:hypothetical protein
MNADIKQTVYKIALPLQLGLGSSHPTFLYLVQGLVNVILSTAQHVSLPHKTEKYGTKLKFQRAVPTCSSFSDSQSDAVAVKFCLRLRTLDLYKSDLWQTTTVPPWFALGTTFPFAFPIKVPIIFDTENFRVFWVFCSERHSFRTASMAL